MSNWEKKRDEMHRLIVRRSRVVSVLCATAAILSVLLAAYAKCFAEERENYNMYKLRQEMLRQK